MDSSTSYDQLNTGMNALDYGAKTAVRFTGKNSTYTVLADGVLFIDWMSEVSGIGLVGIISEMRGMYIHLESRPAGGSYASSEHILQKGDVLTTNLYRGVDGQMNGYFIPIQNCI